MIPQEVIDDILNRISLVDLISKHIEVKKSGRNYLALCPFHNEKTPSFSINDEKGFYHCFGCKASGNAAKFLMEYRKMTFPEALSELAKIAGVDLSKYSASDNGFAGLKEKKRFYEINKEAMVYFSQILFKDMSGEEARKYLKRRRISSETAKFFRIGFGGTSWNGLLDYLKEKGYGEEELLKVSLVSKNERGNVYDRFKDRVVFPIFDRSNNVVGFGGRILDNNKDIAKYLNTSENIVFHKGELLFALNFASDEITKQRECLIVEGYMDVIALFQNGINFAVAPLGTSLTENQLALLKRYADKVTFIFDGDSAGLKAANRALDISASSEIAQEVVILPQKSDPYDFVMAHGRDEFLAMVEKKRLSPIDFKLKYFSKQFKDKIKFLTAIFDYVAKIPHIATQEDYLKRIADFSDNDISAIKAEYDNFRKRNRNFGSIIKEIDDNKSGIHPIELDFIAALCAEPSLIPEFSRIVSPKMIENGEVRELFEFAVNNADKTSKEILDSTTNEEIIRKSSQYIVMDPELNPGIVVAYRLKRLYIKRLINKNIKELQRSDLNKDARDKLLEENQKLSLNREKIDEAIKKFDYESKSKE